MSLRDWLKNSWLIEHKTSTEEIATLLALVERDLANAQVAGLVSDREAGEMREFAAALRKDVLIWLRKNHPKLLPR